MQRIVSTERGLGEQASTVQHEALPNSPTRRPPGSSGFAFLNLRLDRGEHAKTFEHPARSSFPFLGRVGVPLRHAQAPMSRKLLHCPCVDPTTKEGGDKRMAKAMEALSFDSQRSAGSPEHRP
jgi:hypothetical protein